MKAASCGSVRTASASTDPPPTPLDITFTGQPHFALMINLFIYLFHSLITDLQFSVKSLFNTFDSFVKDIKAV